MEPRHLVETSVACYIDGVYHDPSDQFYMKEPIPDYAFVVAWHNPPAEDTPEDEDPVPVPEPVPKEDPEQEAEKIDDEPENDEAQQAQQEEPAKAIKRGRRRKADNVTE